MSATVLVVEDDEDSRNVLLLVLASEGYTVAAARNGLEGLQQARVLHPDVILLDLQMPVMDGVSFRRNQARHPEIAAIPVICISALHNASAIAREAGAVDCVTKPVDFDRLLELVSTNSTPGRPDPPS
jgi:CheY-like chemotaxis protein